MRTRERILMRIKLNQPRYPKLDYQQIAAITYSNTLEQFKTALIGVGATVIEARHYHEISRHVKRALPAATKIYSGLPQIEFETIMQPDSLADIQLAILPGQFGVAENGAIWISDKHLPDRAAPFICEHLIMIVEHSNVVANLHDAYALIHNAEYEYGTFIAGPSKTADIEQSLVYGAHGPRTLTVFIMLS